MTKFNLVSLALSLGVGALCLACSGSSTSSATVSAIDLSPTPCTVGKSDSRTLTATATLPDGTKKDISSSATWSTDNSQTATVNGSGVVVGVNTGVTKITASYEGASGSEDCTVGP